MGKHAKLIKEIELAMDSDTEPLLRKAAEELQLSDVVRRKIAREFERGTNYIFIGELLAGCDDNYSCGIDTEKLLSWARLSDGTTGYGRFTCLALAAAALKAAQ